MSERYEILVARIDERCDNCGKCEQECDVAAIDDAGVRMQHCQLCYACVDVCPQSAFEVVDTWRERPAGLVGVGRSDANGPEFGGGSRRLRLRLFGRGVSQRSRRRRSHR